MLTLANCSPSSREQNWSAGSSDHARFAFGHDRAWSNIHTTIIHW